MLKWITEHPIETAVVVANAIVNGLRLAYPLDQDRPRAVLFILGFLDPVALNFWGPRKAAALKARDGG